MAHPALCELFVGHPDFNEVIGEPALQGAWWQRAWHLVTLWRSQHVDTIVISNPKKEYHVAAWLTGIPTRVGYDRKWGWLLTHRVTDRKALGERHEVEYNLELLHALGISVPRSPSFQLSVSEEEKRRILQLLEELKVRETDHLVAIHPWTSNPNKQWPSQRFRALIDRLAQMPGVKPVVIGGKEERAREAEVLEGQKDHVVNVVGRLSLTALAALLQRVRLLVSNDSGPMHLAAAVSTPVIALFGTAERGSHPRRWGPWGSGHTVIHKPLLDISVEEVLGAVQRYLS